MKDPIAKASHASDANVPPNGPAWAALLSAGVGGAGFGVLTIASECSARAGRALACYRPSGSLSGVAIGAIFIWLAAWAALHLRWKNKSVANEKTLALATFLLVLAALLATFPPFYELFVKGG